MGNLHAQRGRLAPAILLTGLAVLALAAFMALTAGPASATPTFTTCSSCHNYSFNDTFHKGTTHALQDCTKCHPGGGGTAVVPSACASCHGTPVTIINNTKTTHLSTGGCGSTATGCHFAAAPTPTPTPTATVATTTLTAKVAPTTVKVRKSVKVTGTAGPAASLKGAKVAWKVERKVGTKWTKMKAGTAIASTTGTFTVTYKAVKKGAHRVTLSIAKTSTYTAKKLVKAFKVK
jgi:hypothetical protein